VVEAVADVAAAIKPQVAFFERHGARGLAALEEVMAAATDAGLLVIADAKRGDIDSTMAAYGEAWLGDGRPLCADALTVTAYLGLGAMEDVIARAIESGRGLFVVVASSNPEGRLVQEAVTDDGTRVESSLLRSMAARNQSEKLSTGRALGSLGAVVGATRTVGSLDLAELAGPFLVPGLGAQGATPADVRTLCAGCPPHSVLASASRSVLAAGPQIPDLAAAARALADELRSAIGDDTSNR
jgi:orotidine-5'-phosphate decarboxylase